MADTNEQRNIEANMHQILTKDRNEGRKGNVQILDQPKTVIRRWSRGWLVGTNQFETALKETHQEAAREKT